MALLFSLGTEMGFHSATKVSECECFVYHEGDNPCKTWTEPLMSVWMISMLISPPLWFTQSTVHILFSVVQSGTCSLRFTSVTVSLFGFLVKKRWGLH